MSHFWAGFEKQAASIIGRAPNVASGLKKFTSPGNVKAPKGPTSGVSIAPRSIAPPMPTPKPMTATKAVTSPAGGSAAVAQPNIGAAPTSGGRGVSSMTI